MPVVLATGSYDGFIRLWDVATEACTQVISFGTTVNSLMVSQDRRMLLAAGFGHSSLIPLDAPQPQPQPICTTRQNVTQAIFVNNRACVASACETGEVFLTSFQTGQSAGLIKQKAAFNTISHVPGTDYVITGDQRGLLKVWDLRSTKEPVASVIAFEYDVGVRSLSISNRGGILACGDARGVLQAYSVSFERGAEDCLCPMSCIQAHSNMISHVSVSTDGQYISSSGADNACKIWKLLPNGSLARYIEKTHNESTVWGCVFSADTQYFITAADRLAKLWTMRQDADNEQAIKTFLGHTRFVTCVALGDAEV